MTSSLGVFNPNIEFFQAMVITGIGGLLTMSAWVRARRHKEGNVMDTMVLLAPLGGALLLVGGMLGAIWGNQGTLTLRKGEASEVFFDKAGRTHPLNFSVRLKDFQIEYYPQGEDEPVEQPIQKLRSVLEIRESKQVQKESVVQVNQPVSYKGYTFYQMDYNPEDLTWSGLGVIKNPGVPVISVGLAVFSVGLLVTLLRYYSRAFL